MITLLSTKLYFPPPRPKLVPRPRLINRLIKGLQGPLTLIAAPAGYGKSTLLAAWHAGPGRDIPVAWLSLDEGDNDPLRFWFYIIAALNTLKSGWLDDILSLLESAQLPLIENLLTSLINTLNNFPNHFVLVLDNVHVINSQEIHQGIDFLVGYLPPHAHLVMMTRADPPLALPQLRASGRLTEIRAHDLHFTQDETSDFLNDMMELDLSADEVASLQVHTEGWVTGLQLAALSMQGREDIKGFITAFTGSHHFILDFLVEEVLHQQPKPLQDFLLRTSILERFTGSLCEAVTGQADGQATLEYLEHINLFLIPLDDDRYWYRYHNLFADMLRNRLRTARDIDILALHHEASVWFEEHQLADEAMVHAVAAQDLQRAALLVEQNGLAMIQRGELHSLLHYTRQLPEDIIQNRPWLCAFMAWGRYHYGPRDETTRYITMAENALKTASWITEQERKHITSFMAAIRAFKAIHEEDVPYAFQMANIASNLAPEWGFVSRLSAMALGLACWGRGDVIGAEQAMHRASLIALKLGDLSHAISGAGYEAMQQIKQARLQDAFRTLNNALAVLPGGHELPNSAFAYIRLADLSREWNDLDIAEKYINKATEILSQAGSPDFLADAYIMLARISLARNDLSGARKALEMAQSSMLGTQPDPRINSWLDEVWIRLWFEEGNLSAANRWADNCDIDPEGPFRYLRDLDHINLARVWVVQSAKGSAHRLSEALRLLDRLHQAAESARWTHEIIKICILNSLACQVANDDQGMLSAMSKALTLAEPAGYIRIFVDEGEPMVKLLRLAGSRGITPQYVHRLISEFSSSPLMSPATKQPLIEPLSKRELEVLKLLVVGKSNQEIASQLVISLGTVKRHVFNIFGKMNVKSRTECAMRARELHLL